MPQVFGYLFKGDWEARSKQLTRLGREEKLAALGLQLANGKRIPIRALQDSARVVIIAGTEAQVRRAGGGAVQGSSAVASRAGRRSCGQSGLGGVTAAGSTMLTGLAAAAAAAAVAADRGLAEGAAALRHTARSKRQRGRPQLMRRLLC